MKKHDGDRILVCFHNTRSFWSTAYHPGKNALYIPHSDACLDMTENYKNPAGFGPRRQVMRPGADPKKFTSIAKVNLSTGKVDMIHSQPVPGNGSALVTAGDLVFWGDMDRRFRAFDADSGKIVWETILGGIISTSTITYSVNGRQYVAVLTGDAQSGTAGLLGVVKTSSRCAATTRYTCSRCRKKYRRGGGHGSRQPPTTSAFSTPTRHSGDSGGARPAA